MSTAGGDSILQDVLTETTAGQLLVHRDTTPLLSVKTFLYQQHVTVTGPHVTGGPPQEGGASVTRGAERQSRGRLSHSLSPVWFSSTFTDFSK